MCIPCPLCEHSSFDSLEALRRSLVKVSSGPLPCPICNEQLQGLDKLTIHLFSHTEETPVEQNKCDLCDVSFRSPELMQTHYKLMHQNIANPFDPEGEASVPQPELPFRCHFCAKAFKMKGSLRVHLKVVHSFRMPFVNNAPAPAPASPTQPPSASAKPTVKDAGSTPAKTTDSAKIWECDVCSKMFTTKYFLKKHKRLHSGEMPYSCDGCGKTFTFQQSYHKHLLYHSGDKPYVCQSCGRAFKELSTLHNHERIHSGEKPFKCEVCEKCFRQRVSYLVHKRIHTGVMPYKCPSCEKSFRYKVSLRTHICSFIPKPDQPPAAFFDAPASLQELDDLVAESCNKMGIDAGPAAVRTPSPSDKLQHLSINGGGGGGSAVAGVGVGGFDEEVFKFLLYDDQI